MKFILAGLIGAVLAITTIVRDRPRCIPLVLYWVNAIVGFSSSCYLLYAIYFKPNDFNYDLFFWTWIPTLYFGGFISHCWYKEKGKKRPWWGI